MMKIGWEWQGITKWFCSKWNRDLRIAKVFSRLLVGIPLNLFGGRSCSVTTVTKGGKTNTLIMQDLQFEVSSFNMLDKTAQRLTKKVRAPQRYGPNLGAVFVTGWPWLIVCANFGKFLLHSKIKAWKIAGARRKSMEVKRNGYFCESWWGWNTLKSLPGI